MIRLQQDIIEEEKPAPSVVLPTAEFHTKKPRADDPNLPARRLGSSRTGVASLSFGFRRLMLYKHVPKEPLRANESETS